MNRKIVFSHLLRFLPGAYGMKHKRRYYRRLINHAQHEFYSVVSSLNKESLVVDLGANQGKYTRILAEKAGKVIAFEPDPVAFSILQNQLENYPNVELIHAAVSNQSGNACMFRRESFTNDPVAYTEGTSLFAQKENIDKNNSIPVKVINFIDYIQYLDNDIALIKMDIEGAEVDVLESILDSEFANRIGHIFVETHEFKIPELYKRTMDLRKRIRQINRPVINLNWG